MFSRFYSHLCALDSCALNTGLKTPYSHLCALVSVLSIVLTTQTLYLCLTGALSPSAVLLSATLLATKACARLLGLCRQMSCRVAEPPRSLLHFDCRLLPRCILTADFCPGFSIFALPSTILSFVITLYAAEPEPEREGALTHCSSSRKTGGGTSTVNQAECQ